MNPCSNLIPESLESALSIPVKKTKSLFICTGNTCRSPMCAALYNDRFAGDDSAAFSRGLYADGSSITRNAAMVLKENGIVSTSANPYADHFSKTVTEDDMEMSDLVIGVSSSHAMELIFRFPSCASKITSLPMNIPDPFGGDLADYRLCFTRIEEALDAMFVKETPNENC